MINKVTVALEQPEYSALLKVAVAELRNPSDQLHHILRQELQRRGLLDASDQEGGECNAIEHATTESRVTVTSDGTTYHITLVTPQDPVLH